MYSLGNLLKQQPAAIAGAVRAILLTLVILGLVRLEQEALAGIALALEVVLTLFVYQASTSASKPTLDEGTVVKVSGTDATSTVEAGPVDF